MKVKLFSIRDKLSGYGQPMADVSEATAKRNFAYAINNNDQMNFSPSDYDLYYLGDFDTEKGVFWDPDSGLPEFIVSGASVFNMKEK